MTAVLMFSAWSSQAAKPPSRTCHQKTGVELGASQSDLLSLPAAASSLHAAGAAEPAAAQDRVVITAPELARSGGSTVYGAIRGLRPQLLRARPSGYLMYFSERRPVVAVNEEVKGGLEVLQAMPVGEVALVEYIDARGAKQRYGMEVADGLVLVVRAPALADASGPR